MRKADHYIPDKELSSKAFNALRNAEVLMRSGWRGRKRIMKEALLAIKDGRLKPNKSPGKYGWKTHEEVCKWLGIPFERPERKVTVLNRCPHCGKALVE